MHNLGTHQAAFDAFLAEFKQTPQWITMQNTVENSPWHREANVAVHTEMVMQQYVENFAAKNAPRENMVALLALLFHDTGKPAAEETVEKQDGSGETYRRYAGHEQDSAITFLEAYVSMPSLRTLITTAEARAVRWMIEHHLPYGLKDVQKRYALAVGTFAALRDAQLSDDSYHLFFDCLYSDAAGRISDDHEQKLQNVRDWIRDFMTIDAAGPAAAQEELIALEPKTLHQTMYLLVGPSGSGKSTYIRQLTRDLMAANMDIISMDHLKEVFFKHNTPEANVPKDPAELYAAAWQYCTIDNEKAFAKYEQEVVRLTVKNMAANGVLVVDLTNLSRKARARWVTLARQHKMHVHAIEFWNTTGTLLARQKTRGDKDVPVKSVLLQVAAHSSCFLGTEVDHVKVVIGS